MAVFFQGLCPGPQSPDVEESSLGGGLVTWSLKKNKILKPASEFSLVSTTHKVFSCCLLYFLYFTYIFLLSVINFLVGKQAQRGYVACPRSHSM